MFLRNIKKNVSLDFLKRMTNTNFTSKVLPNDILLLRHAQSQYNVASSQYCLKNNIQHLSWD